MLPIGNRDEELDKMNEGKKGRPYEFPESFIKIQAVWHQWVDYRGLEGIARSLEKLCLIPYHDDYTTIWQRVHGMRPLINFLRRVKHYTCGSTECGFKTFMS